MLSLEGPKAAPAGHLDTLCSTTNKAPALLCHFPLTPNRAPLHTSHQTLPPLDFNTKKLFALLTLSGTCHLTQLTRSYFTSI